MANEATIIELGYSKGDVTQFTVASGTTIEKGTLLVLTDPNTAAASSAASGRFCGVAAMEKDGTDYSTTISAFREGVFDMTTVTTAGAEGAIQAGDLVEISGANIIRRLSGAATYNGFSGSVGVALETASGGEVIAVRINK